MKPKRIAFKHFAAQGCEELEKEIGEWYGNMGFDFPDDYPVVLSTNYSTCYIPSDNSVLYSCLLQIEWKKIK